MSDEMRALLTWRPGRSAAEQTALMDEHSACTKCHDERMVVVDWKHGNAVWATCPRCNADG